MITALIFNTQNIEGELFEEVFDLAPEASESISGLYTAIVQSSTDLTSDFLLCSDAHEANLKKFGEVQDFESFETLAKQLDKAKSFATGSVTVAFETKQGRGTKKIVPLVQYKKGLQKLVKLHLETIETVLLKEIQAGTFKPVGLELMSDLINERSNDLVPVLKTAKTGSIADMFKKYVKANASNVVEMQPDLSDEDFDETEIDNETAEN